MKKETLLLTGGSGFIGRNLLESFLAEKYNVLAPRHSELDLSDEVAVERFFESFDVDYVVHSAAKPGHRNASDPTGIFYTNTRIFFNLARLRHRFKKLVVTGSGAIYDMRHYQSRMPEEYFDSHVPVDEHGLSKYVIEQFLSGTNNVVDLRIFGIYGKYEDYQIRFISNMACKALLGIPLTMNQDREFDYIFVEDLAPIIDCVLENNLPWHSLNVTPDKSSRLLTIAEMVSEVAESKLPIVVKHSGAGLPYSGDNTRLRSILPDLRLTSLRTGIEKLVVYYRSILSTLDRSAFLVDK